MGPSFSSSPPNNSSKAHLSPTPLRSGEAKVEGFELSSSERLLSLPLLHCLLNLFGADLPPSLRPPFLFLTLNFFLKIPGWFVRVLAFGVVQSISFRALELGSQSVSSDSLRSCGSSHCPLQGKGLQLAWRTTASGLVGQGSRQLRQLGMPVQKKASIS